MNQMHMHRQALENEGMVGACAPSGNRERGYAIQGAYLVRWMFLWETAAIVFRVDRDSVTIHLCMIFNLCSIQGKAAVVAVPMHT